MNFRTRKAVVVFDVVVGMLSYIVGTNFRTSKAVVVFDIVVGLYHMLWVRFFVPARLCVALDVVVRMLSYIVGTNFRTRMEEGVSWKDTAFRGEVFQGTASYPIDISLG